MDIFHSHTLGAPIHKTLVAVIFMTVILMISSIGEAATKRDAAWYAKHGVTIVTPTNSAPLSFQGMDGNPKGYVIDIWGKWSNKTGIPVKFRFAEWTDTLDLVASGECDIHSGLYINEKRAQFLDFSMPFHELESALLVKKKYDANLATIYETYTVGVLEEGYTEYFIRKNKLKIKVKTFPAIDDIAKALANDTIQAAAGDHPILIFEIGKRGSGHELIVKQILFTKTIHGAVTKGNTTLLELVDQGLSDITIAEYKNIASHWFVFHAKKIDWFRYGLFGGAILFVATMIAILLGRSKAGLDFEE